SQLHRYRVPARRARLARFVRGDSGRYCRSSLLLVDQGEMTSGGMRVLFSATEIAARVEALAAELARTLPADFVMVGVLKGAWMFVADLARALERAGAGPEIEFMRLASYGLAKESGGGCAASRPVPTRPPR